MVVALARPGHIPDVGRHVQSQLITLTSYGSEPDPIWVVVSSERDFTIRPDGSGEISTHFTGREFPTPAEEAQWMASGQDVGGDTSETFAPGGLFYEPADDVRSGINDPALRTAPAGDALRRIATLLTETVPSVAIQDAALGIARDLADVEIVEQDDSVSITGLSGKGNLRITLVFQTKPTRFVEEIWTAQVRVTGLDLEPPFVSYDLTTLLSEPLPTY